jgi:uncharacterized protein YbgA (DUF1722 family)/uncharacterized protein YbbK (DUF523 family)
MNAQEKILLGVSSCLLGEEVRFDGGHQKNAFVSNSLAQFFEFKSFCPEVSIGLGIPREAIRLERQVNLIKCVSSKDSEKDYTAALTESANKQRDWHKDLCGYVVKRKSPSCGMERVKVFENGHPSNTGVGIYTKQLMENFPNLPVEEEGRLEDPVIRENFIQRVIIYKRWKDLCAEGLTRNKLTRFHGQHKLVLMSHDQDLTRSLGSDLSNTKEQDAQYFSEHYINRLMELLKIKATVKNHVNVLQHIQGYLKKDLNKMDKEELTEVIHEYRLERLPLIVPITLLRHHFRAFPNEYIENSYYMKPHPKELMLLNQI